MCTGTEDGRWDDSMILSLGDLGEAVDSRDEDMFNGMPLLGGKGGEGFDKTMPLLKACDNSAIKGLLFLLTGLGGGIGGCLAGAVWA